MRKKIISLTSRDVRILNYLWKWKILSTAAIRSKFFGGSLVKTSYNRLKKLEQAKLVRQIFLPASEGNAWTLAQKGFTLIREKLPQLQSEGYKSEHTDHDFLTSAFHLGEWLINPPENAVMISEQQLRRYPADLLPSWLPKPKLHRPDGYIYLTNDDAPRLLAIELEISRKTSKRYFKVKDFYNYHQQITDVIWIASNLAHARSIQENLLGTQREQSKHQFITLSNFQSHGWAAEVQLGSAKGTSYHGLLTGLGHEIPRIAPGTVMTQDLLNLSLSSEVSTT